VRILSYDFMQRALLAAALIGIAAPAIGVFLVQRRLSLMGDGIGHVTFMGVGAGLLFDRSPVLLGMVAAVAGAALIELLRERGRIASDVALALIFYGGIAGGALLTFGAGATNQAMSYLFGSVLAVKGPDLALLAAVTVLVLALTFGLRRQLFAVCYDEDVARVSGLPVRWLNMLIAFIAALTIGVTMRVVGLLLVAPMLVLPVAAVQQITTSFRATVLWSLVLGCLVSVVGLVAAFYASVAPGPMIVACAIGTFAITSLAARIRFGRVVA
jgi:zinc transport system permease protein